MKRTGLLFALCGLAACSTDQTSVLESTTTTIGSPGGTAISADGLFQVTFVEGAVAEGTKVTIRTLANEEVMLTDLASRVYEVSPSDLASDHPIQVRYAIGAGTPDKQPRIAIVDGDQPEPIDSVYEVDAGWVRAEVESLSANRYAALLVETVIFDEFAWDAPPGTGRSFVINNIAIASRDRGFDIDGACDSAGGGCIDNALYRLGDFWNDQIRQGVLGGEGLALFEIAGIEEPYNGDEGSIVLKSYRAFDADDPFFPANNFKVPPGHTVCCQFVLDSDSLAGIPPQARSRAPAEIERGRLRTLQPTSFELTLIEGDPEDERDTFAIRLERALISGRLPNDLSGFKEGLIGGALAIPSLAQSQNPFCHVVSALCPVRFDFDATMLDFVSVVFGPRPDVDLDGDGLECVLDTDGDSFIDLCCDGEPTGACGSGLSACPAGTRVLPVDPNVPGSCVHDPRMADGYSIGMSFTAVPASVVGVR